MKFFDKLYVGFSKGRYQQTDDQRVLGFMTPYEDNAAGRKRMVSVDYWRDENIEPLILDNIPLSGFKIVDVVSRYSTSNKYFRVEDPRGFELEIDTDNLLSLIGKYTIVNGTIVEPLIWGRDNGNVLISKNSEEYVNFVASQKKYTLTPGMYFKHKLGNIIYRFEGKFAFNKLKYNDHYEYTDPYWRRTINHVVMICEIQRCQKSDLFVYSEFHTNEDGMIPDRDYQGDKLAKNCLINLRKSKFKDLILIDPSEIKDEWIIQNKFETNRIYSRSEIASASYDTSLYEMFDTKEEADARQYKFEEIKKITNRHYGDDYYSQYKHVKYLYDIDYDGNKRMLAIE